LRRRAIIERLVVKAKSIPYLLLGRDPMGLKLRYYRSCGVIIGRNMRAFSELDSAEPYLLSFGDDVTVSPGVRFVTHDNAIGKFVEGATDAFGAIRIGNGCFLGLCSIILPGVALGDRTIVAAGSVVTKSFPDGNVVIGGNPAEAICDLETYVRKNGAHALCTRNMGFEEKKKYLLENAGKFLGK